MTDSPRDPLQSLLDVVVYAPIGAFFHGPETVNELAVRGRSQVNNARVIGKVALAKGRQEAERAGATAQRRVTDALVAAARAAGAPLAGAEEPPTDEAGETPPAAPRSPRTTAGSRSAPTRRSNPLRVVSDDVPEPTDLPIPDYDNLSASQVVPRLEDLGDAELAAVRDYEQAHRGRMTILSRIAQLQAS